MIIATKPDCSSQLLQSVNVGPLAACNVFLWIKFLPLFQWRTTSSALKTKWSISFCVEDHVQAGCGLGCFASVFRTTVRILSLRCPKTWTSIFVITILVFQVLHSVKMQWIFKMTSWSLCSWHPLKMTTALCAVLDWLICDRFDEQSRPNWSAKYLTSISFKYQQDLFE